MKTEEAIEKLEQAKITLDCLREKDDADEVKAVISWIKDRPRYTLVTDEFGYQYMIPEDKKDEWGRYININVLTEPLPAWAQPTARTDVVFYLQ